MIAHLNVQFIPREAPTGPNRPGDELNIIIFYNKTISKAKGAV